MLLIRIKRKQFGSEPPRRDKFACMRIGSRFIEQCANVSIQDSQELNWVKSCRYLGVTVESTSHFKCNISEAEKSFYRSFNAIFGRVGRIANENITVELLIKNCLPTLLYAFEVCPLTQSDIRTLDYVVDCAVKEFFNTNSKDMVLECRLIFNLNSTGDSL
jgi:hypothetical protein